MDVKYIVEISELTNINEHGMAIIRACDFLIQHENVGDYLSSVNLVRGQLNALHARHIEKGYLDSAMSEQRFSLYSRLLDLSREVLSEEDAATLYGCL